MVSPIARLAGRQLLFTNPQAVYLQLTDLQLAHRCAPDRQAPDAEPPDREAAGCGGANGKRANGDCAASLSAALRRGQGLRA